jgi:hypothetical protein
MNGALLRWGSEEGAVGCLMTFHLPVSYVYVHVWEIPAAVFFHSDLPEIAIGKFMS